MPRSGEPWAITRSQAIALGTSAALVVVALVGGLIEHRLTIDAGDWSMHAIEVTSQAQRLLERLTDAETGQRGYLLTGDDAYLEPYARTTATVSRDLERLGALTRDDPEQRRRVDELAPLVGKKLGELAQTISVRRTQGAPAALAIVQTGAGKSTMDDARRVLADVQDGERRLLAERLEQRASRSRVAEMLMVVSALSSLLLGGVAIASVEAQGRERRRAQRRTAESEDRLRTTLRSIGDAVIATDVDGRIVFMNGVAEQLTGWAPADARGRSLDEVFRIVNEETRATVESPAVKVLREGTVVGLANHTVLIARDGREIPIDDSGAPIRDAGGTIMGVVLVFRDVSDRKVADAQRERLNVALAANVAKDEFLAVLSHELRSPLHAMMGWVTVLKRGARGPEERTRAVDTIERNIRIQAKLVDDLLDVSRIVADKLVLAKTPVSLGGVVGASVDSIRPTAAAKDVALTVDVGDGPDVVLGDPKRLEQVVTNLLGNAVKFTPSGGHVSIRLGAIDGRAIVRVEDTGAGLAPDFLPHVFERFRQADASSTRVHGGLGLGLSIVRHIVERHGGHVTAESPGLGCGSTFRVVLPLHAGDALPASGTAIVHAATLADVDVVLVEDDDDTREAIRFTLAASGARVRAVASSADARRACVEAMPDVVVSDIAMPGEDGYRLLAALRAMADGVPLRAVAMSGIAPTPDGDAPGARFDAYLVKPIDPDVLAATIRRVVDGGAAA